LCFEEAVSYSAKVPAWPVIEILDREHVTNLPFRPPSGPTLQASGRQKHETFLSARVRNTQSYVANPAELDRFASTASGDQYFDQRVT